MTTIGIDTNIIIYWLENNPEFTDDVQRLLSPIIEQKERSVVSVILFTEFIAGAASSSLLSPLFLMPNLAIVDVTHAIAVLAGELSKSYNLKPLDAIHLSTAIESGATKFVTNDKQLLKLDKIRKLEIIGLR